MKLFIVDAFTDRPFAGNPAAVCLLTQDRDSAWMQQLAAEMNLSETAFLQKADDGYRLRWFTPQVEVDLCGHATLASAHVLWNEAGNWLVGNSLPKDTPLRFQTRSGVLTASPLGEQIQLDFPATPATPQDPPDGLLEALGVASPVFVGTTKFDVCVVLSTAAEVRALAPDFPRLRQLRTRGVMVTAPADDPKLNFISRFFAPAAGVDEDPVTGSAHCCLAPYWGQQLGKTNMAAYQASSRGGFVQVELRGDRVLLSGQAVTVLRGEVD